jgi:hypothetical protein
MIPDAEYLLVSVREKVCDAVAAPTRAESLGNGAAP